MFKQVLKKPALSPASVNYTLQSLSERSSSTTANYCLLEILTFLWLTQDLNAALLENYILKNNNTFLYLVIFPDTGSVTRTNGLEPLLACPGSFTVESVYLICTVIWHLHQYFVFMQICASKCSSSLRPVRGTSAYSSHAAKQQGNSWNQHTVF